MKRFHFSLERLLSYRRTQLETAEREFAAIRSQVEKFDFEIRSLEEELEERSLILLEQRLSADTRREVLGGHSYLQLLWFKMVRLRGELESWLAKLEDARLRLEEANKELKAIETLRERAFAEYNDEVKREETRDSDEAGRNSFLMKQRKDEQNDA